MRQTKNVKDARRIDWDVDGLILEGLAESRNEDRLDRGLVKGTGRTCSEKEIKSKINLFASVWSHSDAVKGRGADVRFSFSKRSQRPVSSESYFLFV